jgi:hypothetical protein
MNRTKVAAIVVLVVLALVISWLIPNVAGAGRERSLVQRVEALEQQVALLTARVEELEETAASCCSCSVLHLTPLADFPNDPSEGDLCVVGAGEDRHIYSYLDGDWVVLDEMLPPPIPPGPGPPTEPLP